MPSLKALPNWTIEDDRRVIAETNAMARTFVAEKHGAVLPEGNRCDLGHGSSVQHSVTIIKEWQRACEVYKMLNGIDPSECLARHEADIRSEKNAPELYLERR